MLEQQLINGLTLGLIYALIAVGYTMVYGVIQLINFAHGEIYMLGAFFCVTLITAAGLSPETRFMAYGLIMVLIMRFRPAGLFPAIAASGRANPLLVVLGRRIAAGEFSSDKDDARDISA